MGNVLEGATVMETCKTCRWWDRHAGDKVGECTADFITSPEDTPCLVEMVMVPELQSGGYWLKTGPDFGCIHHEPKEQ
jgi:hypothetical protein